MQMEVQSYVKVQLLWLVHSHVLQPTWLTSCRAFGATYLFAAGANVLGCIAVMRKIWVAHINLQLLAVNIGTGRPYANSLQFLSCTLDLEVTLACQFL